MDWVDVGDPGNPANTVIKKGDGSSGYGKVDYSYRIGKYEVTNSQYADFLNAVAATDTYNLYNTSMGRSLWGGITRDGTSGNYTYSVRPNMGNKPVNFVSWFDSARFANWLANGQPVGMQDASTTEDGGYTFSGLNTVSTRNAGARVYIPNEHEWEKAAFYEAGAKTYLGNGWWKHATGSDVYPTFAHADAVGDVSNPGPNTVNFRNHANWNGSGAAGNVTTVGSAGNETPYGARDMVGNVFEWVTADPTKPDPNGWGPYTVRGGSFENFGHVDIYERNLVHHDNHAVVSPNVGFRVAAAFFQDVDPLLADMDFDGDVDFDDVDAFVLGLNRPSDYAALYGAPPEIHGDINGDGHHDFDDIAGFVDILVADRGARAVPEPTTLLLVALGLTTLALGRDGRDR